jgi:hypothetical protein
MSDDPTSDIREIDPVRQLQAMLESICVDWGFCGGLQASVLIQDYPMLSATCFANAVLFAEGMNPEYELAWMRRLENAFRQRFGECLSAEQG